MHRLLASSFVFLTIGTSAISAAEQFTTINSLNTRPVVAIAGELGVEPQIFADCFVDVKPAKDFNPTAGRERSNKAILLPCLQAANPNISNDLLDRVMNKYRGQHI